jgi:N utilization substance protein B
VTANADHEAGDDPQGEPRVQALGVLYAADVLKLEVIDVERMSTRSAKLAAGTWEHRDRIDAAISGAATAWRIERMPAVDRSILRLGTYELWFTSQPTGVVISEAVGMAKRYSTSKSGAFINGVLSTIAADRFHGGEQ